MIPVKEKSIKITRLPSEEVSLLYERSPVSVGQIINFSDMEKLTATNNTIYTGIISSFSYKAIYDNTESNEAIVYLNFKSNDLEPDTLNETVISEEGQSIFFKDILSFDGNYETIIFTSLQGLPDEWTIDGSSIMIGTEYNVKSVFENLVFKALLNQPDNNYSILEFSVSRNGEVIKEGQKITIETKWKSGIRFLGKELEDSSFEKINYMIYKLYKNDEAEIKIDFSGLNYLNDSPGNSIDIDGVIYSSPSEVVINKTSSSDHIPLSFILNKESLINETEEIKLTLLNINNDDSNINDNEKEIIVYISPEPI